MVDSFGHFDSHWQDYTAAIDAAGLSLPEDTVFTQHVKKVWACSEFVTKLCIRQPQILHELLSNGTLARAYRPNELAQAAKLSSLSTDEASLMSALRVIRQREMLRIAWRDIAGLANLEETLSDLSQLADSLLIQALDNLFEIQVHSSKFIKPYIIAVGKLGGQELNFSSDIDLIFAYPKPKKQTIEISPETFYTRLAQSLTKVMSHVTEDGFVFRMDLRLRPYGSAGPLISSITAMENYYQQQGRLWERYALQKARVIANHTDSIKLNNIIRSFVYRSYIDFSVIQGLRDLKQTMSRESRREDTQDNLKRGPGGIRECEFIVQSLQLIHGGKQPGLQQTHWFLALEVCIKAGLINHNLGEKLKQAYCFLRNAENRLQMIDDRQTQSLPTESENQQRLALAMNFSDWDSFIDALNTHRQIVQDYFADVICAPEEKAELEPDQKIINQLRSQPEIESLIHSFEQSLNNKQLPDIAKARYGQLMPFILQAVSLQIYPEQALARCLDFLLVLARRTVYISLLIENTHILPDLLTLTSKSQALHQKLCQHPYLLDCFLDQQVLSKALSEESLLARLRQYLVSIPTDDLEQLLEAVHRFKQSMEMRVMMADLSERLPLMKVSDSLTNLACVILRGMTRMVWTNLIKRHGEPMEDDGPHIEPQFVIIAYGKLAGLELGYDSDLDLVFLYSGSPQKLTNGEKPISNSEFYLRLAQRILRLLNVHSLSGMLYQVDTRLRPSGRAGLLVSRFTAFANYQQTQAWTWEHQALVRSRVIAGFLPLMAKFKNLRTEILGKIREQKSLREEVQGMLARIQAENKPSDSTEKQLKKGQGGIIEIEFVVQYCVLLWGHKYPELMIYPDNIRILEQLSGVEILSEEDANTLITAYKKYRAMLHEQALKTDSKLVDEVTLSELRGQVGQICNKLYDIDINIDINTDIDGES